MFVQQTLFELWKKPLNFKRSIFLFIPTIFSLELIIILVIVVYLLI